MKRIVCVGGGPAGLYSANLLRQALPDVLIEVHERNRPDDTCGWVVVFSDQTMGNLAAADPRSHAAIRAHSHHWDDIEIHIRGRRFVSGGHGFCGISRPRLLQLLQDSRPGGQREAHRPISSCGTGLAVNLTGTYLCTREAVPDVLTGGQGRIVNIASVAGLRGGAYISAYAASKHAVIGLTRSLAAELAASDITVNAVCPGFTDTDLVKQAVRQIVKRTGRSAEQALAALVAANPQRRLIQPQGVAAAVLWLCGPGSQSVTGQSIVVAGGEAS